MAVTAGAVSNTEGMRFSGLDGYKVDRPGGSIGLTRQALCFYNGSPDQTSAAWRAMTAR
jgi:hypothetical protein